MKVAVLLNAGAGTMARLGPQGVGRVADVFRDRGVEAEVAALPSARIARAIGKLIDSREETGLAAIVVGGGDGTLSCAAGLVAGTGLPLGILPLGTLNHFAKDLAIPLDLEKAAGVIAAGHVRRVDVGELNGRVFVNNSSVGIYPFLVAEREHEQRRRGVGKLLALGPALYRTLRFSSWHRVTVVTGTDRRELRTPCVFVGNNLYDVRALGHRRRIDQAELCVYLIKPQTWLGLALLPIKVAFGLADPARDVELLVVPEIEIRSGRDRLRVALDGESTRIASPLRYRIRPAGLDVLAPPVGEPDGR